VICYTYGYHGRSLRELVAHVERLNAVVIDVRFAPTSRFPEWRRDALRRALGRRYVWVQEFGNVLYQTQQIQLSDPEKGLAVVEPIVRERPIILVCMCADHASCHRAHVADLIAGRVGCSIIPLKPTDVAAEPQQITLL
jgi:uncharacterized protein (DUF488 family)